MAYVDPPTVGASVAPPKDRLFVHAVWEVLLAGVVIGLAVLLYRLQPAGFTHAAQRNNLLIACAIGLLFAVALSSTIRAGVPNLAVGAIGGWCGYLFAAHSTGSLGLAALYAFVAALFAGFFLALFVCLLRVPGWAASLALIAVLLAFQYAGQPVYNSFRGLNPTSAALYWFVGAALVSVVGGGLSLLGGIRRGLSRYRLDGDPAGRPGAGPALLTALLLIGSSLLAGLGGVLMTLVVGASVPDYAGLGFLVPALGAVLLGGVSAFGRRGGVFGVLLGVVFVQLLVRVMAQQNLSSSVYRAAAIAVVGGLAVTRLIERFGRPRRPEPVPVGMDTGETWPLSAAMAPPPLLPAPTSSSPEEPVWPAGSGGSSGYAPPAPRRAEPDWGTDHTQRIPAESPPVRHQLGPDLDPWNDTQPRHGA